MPTTKTAAELTTRCRAFATEGVRENRIRITEDGSVLVWDSVAGHYTRCHSLSPAAQRRIRRMATARFGRLDLDPAASYAIYDADGNELCRGIQGGQAISTVWPRGAEAYEECEHPCVDDAQEPLDPVAVAR